MTSTKTTAAKAATRPEPPAAAVAADAHWAAKMAKLRQRQAPTYTLRVCDDDEAKDAVARAERARRRIGDDLDLNPDDPHLLQMAADADAALTRARERLEAVTLLTLSFRGLPSPTYEALVKKHPPTEEQATDGAAWNEDSFPAALIAAASVDGMSEDDARELMDTWAPAEALALFRAAMAPQQTDRTDLGKG